MNISLANYESLPFALYSYINQIAKRTCVYIDLHEEWNIYIMQIKKMN